MAGYLYEIDWDDLQFHERCGAGTYGSVYRALWKSRNKEVAVKKLLSLEKEAEVVNMLSHRNIIQFYGAVTVAPNYCLVTEFAENGSLYDFLKRPELASQLDFKGILLWAQQIAMGLNYLHTEAPINFIHRDLKSKNVVISGDWTCKICDFGASKFKGSTTKMSLVGTFPWMAPEVIQSLPISGSCDVWSYGVVLWELLTHEIPFDGIEGFQVAWLVVEKGERLTIPSTCPARFGELMRECWQLDPYARPTFRHILGYIDQMYDDEELQDLTQSFLDSKIDWRQEIENTLDRLKRAERDIHAKEQQLREREQALKQREMDLSKQFKVVQLDSHDVNTWREVDVYQWVVQLGADTGTDLRQYADLFLHNNITGRRLLLLSQDDLKAMGISSVGHRLELHADIEELKAQNFRLLHFPPLAKPPTQKEVEAQYKTLSLTLMFGHYLVKGESALDHKWKIYMDCEEGEEAEASSLGPITCIRHVNFTPQNTPGITYRVNQPPYVIERWIKGLTTPITVDCMVTYESNVRKPRMTKVCHVISTGPMTMTQRKVTLTLTREEAVTSGGRRDSGLGSQGQSAGTAGVMSAGAGVTTSPGLGHSVSSPQLKGVWTNRQFPGAVLQPETKRDTPSPWADVVSGKKGTSSPVMFAYEPSYNQPPTSPFRRLSLQAPASSSISQVTGAHGYPALSPPQSPPNAPAIKTPVVTFGLWEDPQEAPQAEVECLTVAGRGSYAEVCTRCSSDLVEQNRRGGHTKRVAHSQNTIRNQAGAAQDRDFPHSQQQRPPRRWNQSFSPRGRANRRHMSHSESNTGSSDSEGSWCGRPPWRGRDRGRGRGRGGRGYSDYYQRSFSDNPVGDRREDQDGRRIRSAPPGRRVNPHQARGGERQVSTKVAEETPHSSDQQEGISQQRDSDTNEYRGRGSRPRSGKRPWSSHRPRSAQGQLPDQQSVVKD